MKPEGKAFDRVSSNEDKRPPARVSGRAHLCFHGSWPSLASKSTSECARKHGKINDMPDTGEGGGREGGRVWRLEQQRRGRRRRRKHQPQQNSFATFRSAASFASPRIAYLSIISPKRATPCPLQLVSCSSMGGYCFTLLQLPTERAILGRLSCVQYYYIFLSREKSVKVRRFSNSTIFHW